MKKKTNKNYRYTNDYLCIDISEKPLCAALVMKNELIYKLMSLNSYSCTTRINWKKYGRSKSALWKIKVSAMLKMILYLLL